MHFKCWNSHQLVAGEWTFFVPCMYGLFQVLCLIAKVTLTVHCSLCCPTRLDDRCRQPTQVPWANRGVLQNGPWPSTLSCYTGRKPNSSNMSDGHLIWSPKRFITRRKTYSWLGQVFHKCFFFPLKRSQTPRAHVLMACFLLGQNDFSCLYHCWVLQQKVVFYWHLLETKR